MPTSAKAKRKPRQPKEPKQPKESKRKSKVITVDLRHTEYVDDPNAQTPPADDLPETEQPPPEVLWPPPALVWQQSTGDAQTKAKSKAQTKTRLY